MKPQFNKMWLLIVIVIIGNIIIFYFMSRKLENYVEASVERERILEGLEFAYE